MRQNVCFHEISNNRENTLEVSKIKDLMCWENGQLVLRCSSLQLIYSSFSRLLHHVMSIITMPAALLYTAALMVPSLMLRSPFFTSNFKLSINLPMPRLEKTPQNFFHPCYIRNLFSTLEKGRESLTTNVFVGLIGVRMKKYAFRFSPCLIFCVFFYVV